MKSKQPDPVDIYVGNRVRARRNMLGWSQEKLANALGLTFQQVQKYENGSNRIGSSRLYALSNILGCSVEFFFEGYSDDSQNTDERTILLKESLQDKQTLDFLRFYYSIKDKNTRKAFANMLKSMTKK